MKKITGWAAASAVIVVLGACTTEVTDNGDGGTSSGSAGSTSSSTTTGSGGSTGGSGGSSGTDGGSCMASATATACETCAFSKCMTEICACKGNMGCNDLVDDYLTCISGLEGGDMMHCAEAFAGSAGSGASQADALAQCMEDKSCLSTCQGRDGGPRF
jgi:hypothetical protein